MPNITELIIILVIVAIVFGFGKLSSLGQTAAKLKNNFKKGLEHDVDESPIDITPRDEDEPPRHAGPKPGTRKEPVEDADIEA